MKKRKKKKRKKKKEKKKKKEIKITLFKIKTMTEHKYLNKEWLKTLNRVTDKNPERGDKDSHEIRLHRAERLNDFPDSFYSDIKESIKQEDIRLYPDTSKLKNKISQVYTQSKGQWLRLPQDVGNTYDGKNSNNQKRRVFRETIQRAASAFCRRLGSNYQH